MLRNRVVLLASAAGVVACLAAVSSVADDAGKSAAADAAAKSPLQKGMVKMEDQTKAIRAVSTSPGRFKKSAQGKDLVLAAEDLVRLSKETRKFTEPAVALKKPQAKWEEYADQCLAASQEMVGASRKKDYAGVRKALKELDNSCTNCHGLFRPKTGGDEFGNP